jgi:hypothetical protein
LLPLTFPQLCPALLAVQQQSQLLLQVLLLLQRWTVLC